MQAIITKFIGPTNHRSARITATCSAGSIVAQWDYSLNRERNHRAAAEKLATQLGWSGNWVGGGKPDNSGNVYVCVDGACGDAFTIADKA